MEKDYISISLCLSSYMLKLWNYFPFSFEKTLHIQPNARTEQTTTQEKACSTRKETFNDKKQHHFFSFNQPTNQPPKNPTIVAEFSW